MIKAMTRLAFVAVLAACSNSPAASSPASTAAQTRATSSAPSSTRGMSTQPAPAPSRSVEASPTTKTYVWQLGDTPISIAYTFGITVQELQKANPNVDMKSGGPADDPAVPNYDVGTILVIPSPSG